MTNTAKTASPTLTIRRTFNASRERVFHAFIDASTLGRWMGPAGSQVSEATFDAREGGTYRFVFNSPKYGTMAVKGIVSALRPPEYLAYTWRWEEDDASLERDTFVYVDFVAQGAATEVILTHDGFEDEASRDRHVMGWEGALGNIEAVL
jgi:glutathione S-transferase